MKDLFKYRGVVEGFYGRPWTQEERKDIIKYMGEKNYNLYIYAPKADKLHRDEWKKLYDEKFLNKFQELVSIGKENKVEVSVAISPGLSLVHSSDEDLECLYKKYMQFVSMGVNTICLFLDDIPWELQHDEDIKKYKNLAEAQADFTNRLYNKLDEKVRNLNFILCPTEYFGKTHYSYHDILGDMLNERIEIMWTGPKVCSETIDIDDAINTSRAYKRQILYWDNYPVNDSMMVPELHMAEYIGRDENLYKYSTGLIINPMNQAYASKIVLGAASHYLTDPKNYNAEKALKQTLKEYNSEILNDFYYFIQANSYSPLSLETPEVAKEILENFEKLMKTRKRKEAKKYLKDQGNKIIKIYKKLEKELDNNLKLEINQWLKEFFHYGELMVQISDLINTYEIIFDENAPIENINKVKAENEKMENLLKLFATFETSVFSDEFVTLAWKNLKISKGLIKSNNVLNHYN